MSQFIKITEHGSAAVIQINRPQAFNAMSIPMFNFLDGVLRKFEQEKDVVVFKGLPNVFSVGGDLKDMTATMNKPFDQSEKSLLMIANYKKPYIALVHGTAMGGAAMFSLSAKYRVVTETTTFAMPENAIGYFTDSGSGYFLSRLERNLGFYMSLTGAKITGSDMMKSKLATHFVQSSKLGELEKDLLNCRSHEDVAKILESYSTSPQQAVTEIDKILPQIEKCFGASTVEEILENLKQDASDWAKKTIRILNKMSPTSLKVSHRFLKLGKGLSLLECMKMETRLVKFFVGTEKTLGVREMAEGVRAMLVDKDYKPKWNLTLAEISETRLDEIFKFALHEKEFSSLRSHL